MDAKDAAILRVLGYDDTHGIIPVKGPGWRGLRIVDASGKPVRFYTEKALTPYITDFKIALAQAVP